MSLSVRYIDTVPVTRMRFQRPWPGPLLLARTFPRLPPVIRHRRFFCALCERCGCHGPGVWGLCPPPGPRSAFRFRGLGLAQIGARPGADFAVAFFFRLGPRRLLLDRRDQACFYWPLWGYYDTPIGCFVLCAHLTVPRFFIVTPKNHAKKKPKKVLTSMDNVCIISGRR